MINQNWVFGQGAKLDFSTPIPTASGGAAINTGEGCASISDSAGNLLFYTDGISLWDATNVLRYTGMLGDPSSTQSSIIVPDPGNANQYYVFTTDGSSAGAPWNHFNGIRINVTTWAAVTLGAIMTMPSTTGLSPVEKVVALQHANCKDFWVITMVQQAALGSNTGPGVFRVFLVNSAGVSHVGDTIANLNLTADLGYMKGSPDGRKLAITNGPNGSIWVYNFDNASGVINIASGVNIPNVQTPATVSYGLEFSPDSNLLYYSVLTQGNVASNVYQVNLNAPIASTLIGSHANPPGNGSYAVGALQMGQDGRIYIAKPFEQSLGAILFPNVVGAGATINWSFITLTAGTQSTLGLPNLLPNACDCPCEGEHCHEEIEEANADLASAAALKSFTIIANGQTLPTGCTPAFTQNSFAPVFTMRWGDGINDHFETHDTEVFYIRVHNPFSNLIFKDVHIFNIRVTPNQVLPSGGNALTVIPAEIVCYEDIGPCSMVSRDFTLMIENSLVGPYQITFDYCIGELVIQNSSDGSAAFSIEVVAS